jgi:hypothetical protein
MNKNDIVYNTTVNGYLYIYHKSGFISVYDTSLNEVLVENSKAQCIYRSQVNCSSMRDFQMEIIYISQKINEYNQVMLE